MLSTILYVVTLKVFLLGVVTMVADLLFRQVPDHGYIVLLG